MNLSPFPELDSTRFRQPRTTLVLLLRGSINGSLRAIELSMWKELAIESFRVSMRSAHLSGDFGLLFG